MSNTVVQHPLTRGNWQEIASGPSVHVGGGVWPGFDLNHILPISPSHDHSVSMGHMSNGPNAPTNLSRTFGGSF